MYYPSHILIEVEECYTLIEKLCLPLYFTYIKLCWYMFPIDVYVICKTNLIKYMLSKPFLRGHNGKWTLALSKFNLHYIP